MCVISLLPTDSQENKYLNQAVLSTDCIGATNLGVAPQNGRMGFGLRN